MPEKQTLARARADKRAGKAPTTQAGEFIREEITHIRKGMHGARSAKQAIAIGLSKARRAGVDLAPPAGATSGKTRKAAVRDCARGHGSRARRAPTAKRARHSAEALKREGTAAASPAALSRQSREAARRRSPGERSRAAAKAVRIQGASGRAAAARSHRAG